MSASKRMVRRVRTTIPDCARESVVGGRALVLREFTVSTPDREDSYHVPVQSVAQEAIQNF